MEMRSGNDLPLRLQPDVESEDDVEGADQRRRGHMAHGDVSRLPFDSVDGDDTDVDGRYVLNWYIN